jgi:hypothetical protein
MVEEKTTTTTTTTRKYNKRRKECVHLSTLDFTLPFKTKTHKQNTLETEKKKARLCQITTLSLCP